MLKLTALLVTVVTLSVVLQFGAETNAVPVPIPPSSCQTGYYSMPYYAQPKNLYRQPQPTYYSSAVQQYQYQPTYWQPQTPFIPPAFPSGFEGVYSANTIVGDGNIRLTGVNALNNVNAPVNVLSFDDFLE